MDHGEIEARGGVGEPVSPADRVAVQELGTVLSVWAHPDDESYCCAGLMAAAVDNGQRVVCVTATRGEQGSTDPARWPAGPQLASIRTAEMQKCLAELGVVDHRWLDYPDGGCADVNQAEAVARVRAIVEHVRPDTVLTFGPDGRTFHTDHIAVSRWVAEAVAGSAIEVFHVANTVEWIELVAQRLDPAALMMDDRQPSPVPGELCPLRVVLDGEELDRKYRAMLHQQSQIGPLLELGGPDFYRALLAEEAFTRAR